MSYDYFIDVTEMQMRQWMHMMTEFAKTHPDAPKPPMPPHMMMGPPRGPPFPGTPAAPGKKIVNYVQCCYNRLSCNTWIRH